MEIKTRQKQQSRRVRMMAGGAVAICFTGFPHVWSVFQPYMMEQTGWSQSMASVSFYLVLAMFVVGNVAGGRIQDSGHHALAIRLGAGLMAGGVLLSSITIHANPLPFYLTYGVMQGLGQGMLYATVLSTAQKWFPDRRGFASGLIVTANGLCGLFMAPLCKMLLKEYGPQTALFAVGGMITLACILCVCGFCVPGNAENTQTTVTETLNGSQKEYTARQMLQTKSFYFLLLAMFFGLLPYFFVSPVSQSYQIEKHIVESVAVSAVMLGSVVNALTRLVLPVLADRVGRVPCIKAILLLAALTMCGLYFSSSYGITVSIILLYGCFGGIMGSFPALTSTLFGLRHAGENYGYVMIGIILATFAAPGLSAALQTSGYSMQSIFACGFAAAVLAFICICLLGRQLKKQAQ